MELAVKIAALDAYSAPAKKIESVSNKLTKAFEANQKQLAGMGKQQAAIDKFRLLESSLGKTSTALQSAQGDAAQYGKGLHQLKQKIESIKADHLAAQLNGTKKEARFTAEQAA